MRQRRVVTLLATVSLIALASGCATHGTTAVASRTESDAPHAAIRKELVGTWNGWFRPVTGADGGGGNGMQGDVTLEIKDDATYRLIATGRGRADAPRSTDSGVVVAKGRYVTLKSSSGRWTSLMLDGDELYGVTAQRGGGYNIVRAREHLMWPSRACLDNPATR